MIAIITNVTCPCGCCGEIIGIYLRKHYEGGFRIEKDRVIFDNDPPLEMFEIVNAELRFKGHQLLTGIDAVYVELIQDALKEMLKSVENRDVLKLTPKEEIKNIQQLVLEKTGRAYDGMEKFYKKKMNMSILHSYIVIKVERLQQLIIEEMEEWDIMIRLNYCNKSYMEKQFRDVTGKKLKEFILEIKFQKNH